MDYKDIDNSAKVIKLFPMRVCTRRTVQVDKTVTTISQTFSPKTLRKTQSHRYQGTFIGYVPDHEHARQMTPRAALRKLYRPDVKVSTGVRSKERNLDSPVSAPISRGATLRYCRILYNGSAGLPVCSALYLPC